MSKLCDICKKNKAIISITGRGQYCYDCHNKMVMDDYGMPDTFNYAKTMSVMEPSGEVHTFEVNHIILGDIVSWEAVEKQGGYRFNDISDIEDNGVEVAKRFFKKIVDGVCTKTLDGYSLKEKGVIMFSEDEDDDYSPVFVIDGKKYAPNDFARLTQGYNGFVMHYQIHDASEPLLGEHEYLVPVKITKENIIAEFENALSLHCNNGFLNNDRVSSFDELFSLIVGKLKIIYDSRDCDYAVSIAKELLKRLAEIETDDDFFPFHEMQMVCEAVDPRGIDDELWEYLKDI